MKYTKQTGRVVLWVLVRATTWLGASALSGACYQPEYSAELALDDTGPLRIPPSIDAGYFEAGDTPDPLRDAQAASADAEAPRPTSLVFRVLTAPFGGRYAPLNIGAIWIQNEAGGFVKTLKVWAAIRQMYLRKFQAVSGGDETDAITSATLDMHEAHEVTWNFRDRSGKEIADGNYTLNIELTDRDASGASLSIPFAKDANFLQVMPATTPQFTNMELILR